LIHLAKGREERLAVLKHITNLSDSKKCEDFLHGIHIKLRRTVFSAVSICLTLEAEITV
jgi:hypothetical protein